MAAVGDNGVLRAASCFDLDIARLDDEPHAVWFWAVILRTNDENELTHTAVVFTSDEDAHSYADDRGWITDDPVSEGVVCVHEGTMDTYREHG